MDIFVGYSGGKKVLGDILLVLKRVLGHSFGAKKRYVGPF